MSYVLVVAVAVIVPMAVVVAVAIVMSSAVIVVIVALVSSTIPLVVAAKASEVVIWITISAVLGEAAAIAEAWVKGSVDRTIEVAGAMEPGPSTEEHAVVEPLGTIVPVRRAVVRCVVEVAKGADRGRATDVDAERDLGVRLGGWDQQECGCRYCCHEKSLDSAHKVPPVSKNPHHNETLLIQLKKAAMPLMT